MYNVMFHTGVHPGIFPPHRILLTSLALYSMNNIQFFRAPPRKKTLYKTLTPYY